jgi:hypothetical protein
MRGQASRLGHHYITTDADGWSLGVNVDGGSYEVAESNGDHFTIYATGGSTERRRSHKIATVEEANGERRITLFDAKGKAIVEYVA